MAKKAREEKRRALVMPSPKNIDELAEYGRTIGKLLNALSEISTDLKEKQLALAEKADEKAAGPRLSIVATAKAILKYADAHRDELTEQEAKKTVELAGVILRWYLTPPAVEFDEEEEEALIEKFEKIGLGRFVTIKKTLNKETLGKELAEGAKIEGVSLSQKEKFAIKPQDTNARVECFTESKRWKIVSEKDEPLPA